MSEEKYMTLDQAAEFLDVTDITLKRYIRENLIQHEEVEGETLLLTDAVVRYKTIAERLGKR